LPHGQLHLQREQRGIHGDLHPDLSGCLFHNYIRYQFVYIQMYPVAYSATT
jgi:hypothetical protein